MARRPPSRRAVLAGALGITAALPFLDLFGPRAHASGRGPKRLVLIHHPQGVVMNQWLPTGTRDDFSLPRLLAPFERHRHRMTVVAGLDNFASRLNHAGNGHERANTTHLTGAPCAADDRRLASAPSFDQVLADRIYDDRPYRSIDLAIGGGRDGTVTSGRQFSAARTPLTLVASPQMALDRLFPERDDGGASRRRERRASVLDGALQQFGALRPRLGHADRQRLDAHAEMLRDLERRVTEEVDEVCGRPSVALPGGYDWRIDDDVTAPVQFDILATALACGLTRVGSLFFTTGHDPEFPWLSVGGGPVVDKARYDNWHQMVHDGREEEGLVKGFEWYAQQTALLLDTLAERVDEDGDNLLDTSLVVFTSEFGNGAGHNTRKIPFVLFGTLGEAPMGRFLDYMNGGADANWSTSEFSCNQLYTSILRAFGERDSHFGHTGDEVPQGPLPGLLD